MVGLAPDFSMQLRGAGSPPTLAREKLTGEHMGRKRGGGMQGYPRFSMQLRKRRVSKGKSGSVQARLPGDVRYGKSYGTSHIGRVRYFYPAEK